MSDTFSAGSGRYPADAPASEALFDRAKAIVPGGVNSPVRAFRAVGGTPRFMVRGEGPWLFDADGRRYVDLVCSWGPLILGHAHPAVVEALREAAALGTSFASNYQLAKLGWSQEQVEAFLNGQRAYFQGKPYALDERARALHEETIRRLENSIANPKQTASAYFSDPERLENYLKEVSKALHLQRADSGLAFGMLTGRGTVRPAPEDTVVISYKVTGPDGQTDLPQLTVEKLRIKVADLLPGLAEGVQMMVPEGRGLFVLPAHLSFGEGPWPSGTEPGSPLIFTVLLHELIPAP